MLSSFLNLVNIEINLQQVFNYKTPEAFPAFLNVCFHFSWQSGHANGFEIHFDELLYYTEYIVEVAAQNRVGHGPKATFLCRTEQAGM